MLFILRPYPEYGSCIHASSCEATYHMILALGLDEGAMCSKVAPIAILALKVSAVVLVHCRCAMWTVAERILVAPAREAAIHRVAKKGDDLWWVPCANIIGASGSESSSAPLPTRAQ